MKDDFEIIWTRIMAHEGEEFKTKNGRPFTYKMDGDGLYPSRTDWRLTKKDFHTAYESVPMEGPGQMPASVFGPSYIWGILHDKRISKGNW